MLVSCTYMLSKYRLVIKSEVSIFDKVDINLIHIQKSIDNHIIILFSDLMMRFVSSLRNATIRILGKEITFIGYRDPIEACQLAIDILLYLHLLLTSTRFFS